MSTVNETVTLRAWIACIGCGRKIDTSEALSGESVRTGNHTQRAAYWLDNMNARVRAAADASRWELLEKGYRCAHCTAAEVDKLGETVTPRRGPTAESAVAAERGRESSTVKEGGEGR